MRSAASTDSLAATCHGLHRTMGSLLGKEDAAGPRPPLGWEARRSVSPGAFLGKNTAEVAALSGPAGECRGTDSGALTEWGLLSSVRHVAVNGTDF